MDVRAAVAFEAGKPLAVTHVQLVDGVPASHVVPANVASRQADYVGGAFQDGVIDRDILAFGKCRLEARCEAAGSEVRKAGQQARCLWQVLTQGAE